MKKESIILSISILISGRKEMRQCLESIKPLLQQLPSELILVDTGCSEEQLSIAREYTNSIVPFTWCNDFSAARNAGLSKACGEWFLFLDDDEWFGDVKEIIDFFQTGEYRKYRCARYYQRNYTTRTGVNKQFVDNVVLRMTQMLPDTRFHGIIHEFLTPAEAPIKDFTCYVEHYGYIFENERDKYRHVERNASLLYKQIELEPTVIRWYSQMAQEYMGIREYEQVLHICQKALDVWNGFQQVDNTQVRSIGAIYGYAAKACEQKFDFEQALEWTQRGIASKLVYECAKAYLYQIQSEIYYDKKAYRECLEAFLAYREIYLKKGSDQYAIAMETSLINNAVFQEIPYITGILRGLHAAIKENKDELAKELFDLLDWNDNRLFDQDELERELIRDAVEEKNVYAIEMLKTLGERNCGILELAPIIAEQERAYRQDGQDEYLHRIQKIAAKLESNHQYILGCKIIVAVQENKLEELQLLYEKIFQQVEIIFKMQDEVWNVADRYGIATGTLFLKANFNKIKVGIDEWIRYANNEQISGWKARIDGWKTESDIRFQYFNLRVSEALLKERIRDNEALNDIEIELRVYAETVLEYYHELYKDEVFAKMPEALPPETQLAVKIEDICRNREQGKVKETIACLRQCIGLYPPLEKIIDLYAQKIRDEIKQSDEKAVQEQKELQHLVKTLKGIAKSKIENGEYDEAKEILQQIEQCIPTDMEIVELMKKAERGKTC